MWSGACVDCRLPHDRVVTWDLPTEPSAVAHARALVTDRLTSWNAAEIVFLTELIVSELVTKAIRYGLPPIRLRLIRERNL